MEDGTRLPSIKELSERLNVSTGTVQSVLQKLAGEGFIRVQKGSGSYLIRPDRKGQEAFRVLVSVPIERFNREEGWTERIGGGIFTAALQARPSLVLEGIAPRLVGKDDLVMDLLERIPSVDGLLLMPYSLLPRHSYVIEAYEKARKPVISLQPANLGETANFVCADYFGMARQVGRVWAASGRKRVAMLRVEPTALHRPVTEALHFGLLSGLGDPLAERVAFEMVKGPDDWTLEGAAAAVRHRLALGGPLPDAWFCENDTSAIGVIAALREARISIPGEASVVAATDTISVLSHADPGTGAVSRFSQPLREIGEAAANLLWQRLLMSRRMEGSALMPGVVVPFTFLEGKTTSSRENILFRTPGGDAPRYPNAHPQPLG